MTKLPDQRDETLGGYIVHGVPFRLRPTPTPWRSSSAWHRSRSSTRTRSPTCTPMARTRPGSPVRPTSTCWPRRIRAPATPTPHRAVMTCIPAARLAGSTLPIGRRRCTLSPSATSVGGVSARDAVRSGADRVRGRQHAVPDAVDGHRPQAHRSTGSGCRSGRAS